MLKNRAEADYSQVAVTDLLNNLPMDAIKLDALQSHIPRPKDSNPKLRVTLHLLTQTGGRLTAISRMLTHPVLPELSSYFLTEDIVCQQTFSTKHSEATLLYLT